jgi:hypothetical protein
MGNILDYQSWKKLNEENEGITFVTLNVFIPYTTDDAGNKTLDQNGEIKWSIPKTKTETTPGKTQTGSWWDGKKVVNIECSIGGESVSLFVKEQTNDETQITGFGPKISAIAPKSSSKVAKLTSLIGTKVDGTKTGRDMVLLGKDWVKAIVNYIGKPTLKK